MEIENFFDIKTDDIYEEGWYSEVQPAHIYFFRFLRISPSYELARKASKGKLTAEEKKRLPKDFDKVLETYALLGDVHNTFFRYWWQKVGHEVFGVPHEYPTVDVISVLDGSLPKIKKIHSEITKHLKESLPKSGNTPAIIVSIPIDKDIRHRLNSVKKLLVSYKNLIKIEQSKIKPKIELMGKRTNRQAFFRGWKLLIFKSAFPDLENWRIGVAANLSPSYSPILQWLEQRKTRDSREAEDRVLMGKITHRSLKKYQYIAENAARGKFPCDAKIEMTPFNYKEIFRLYQRTTRWEEKEFKRLRAISK